MVLKQAPLSMQVATPQVGHSKNDGHVRLWLYKAQSGEGHPKPTQDPARYVSHPKISNFGLCIENTN